jgi:BA14K-like protein
LKVLVVICAVLITAAACPVVVQARTLGGSHFGGAHHGNSHIGQAPVGGIRFGGTGFGGSPVRSRYYGGVYRGRGLAWRGGVYRSAVWAGKSAFSGDWRQSYSPYWAWGVAAGLLATAPAYYDGYGYEASAYDDAVAYCSQRFRSYDPASGTYIGSDGYPRPCP